MPSCIIEGCPNRTGRAVLQEGIILHSFPTSFSNIKKWLESTSQAFQDLDALANKILEGKANDLFRLCSAHFSPECYKSQGKRKSLLKDSIPSIFSVAQNKRLINEESVMASGKKRQKLEPVEIAKRSSLCQRCLLSLTGGKPKRLKNSSTQTDEIKSLHGSGVQRVGDHIEHPYNFPHSASLKKTAAFTLGQDTVLPSLYIVPESKLHIQSPQLPSGTIIAVQVHAPLDQQENIFGNLPSFQTSEQDHEGGTSKIPKTEQEFFAISHQESDLSVPQKLEDTLYHKTPDDPEDYIAKIVKMRKFIVFESCLDELLKKVKCQDSASCLKNIVKINKEFQGSAVIVRGVCEGGHRFKIFESQPKIRRYYSGDLLLASSVVCAGLNFSEVHRSFKTFGMVQFSKKFFHRFQKKFSFPAISLAWQKERSKLLQQFSGKPLSIAGHGQRDRPGDNAKYCVYSLMDIVSGKILDFEVVQSTPCSSSAAMEKDAFEICMSRTIDQGLDVVLFASDQHVGIHKLLRERFDSIDHQFDVSHYAKNISKKLREASQKKLCANLTPWIDKVNNHFSWAINNCANDEEILRKNWQSVVHHIINEHEWEEQGTIEKCSHRELTESEKQTSLWLHEGTPAYEKLSSIVNDQQLLSDLKHLTWSCHTGRLKVYHNTVLKCFSKRINFNIDSMECKTILAALSNNNHVGQPQTVVKCEHKKSGKVGTKSFKVTAPKGVKKWFIRNGHEEKKDFLVPILEDTLRLCEGTLLSSWISRSTSLPSNLSNLA